MSRETWWLIKQSKRFYVKTYRRTGSAIFLSMVTNLLLILGICYVYLNRPAHDFYATSGETPPVMLTPMDIPNNTSEPLLANDPDINDDIKVIPQ
jgi:intracellular multiplication protein IcmM